MYVEGSMTETVPLLEFGTYTRSGKDATAGLSRPEVIAAYRLSGLAGATDGPGDGRGEGDGAAAAGGFALGPLAAPDEARGARGESRSVTREAATDAAARTATMASPTMIDDRLRSRRQESLWRCRPEAIGIRSYPEGPPFQRPQSQGFVSFQTCSARCVL